MKFLRYEDLKRELKYGILEDDTVYEADGDIYNGLIKTAKTHKLSELKLKAPVVPSKIVAVGKNYYDHAMELGGKPPENPILFIKPNTALNDPYGTIIYPAISKRVDYEGELAFIIKKTAKFVPKEKAFEYILGYTCLNDVTARDIQSNDGQWTRAKGFDSFAPVGPVVTTDIKNPDNLDVITRLNGKVVQKSNTSKFLWNIAELMEFITSSMTLNQGDIVTTGTPEGIGPMQPGDTVEVEIEDIGILKNTVGKV